MNQPKSNKKTSLKKQSEEVKSNLSSSKDTPVSSEKPSEIRLHQQSTAWSGPLPPPFMLEEYKDILPNAPERIFEMTEKQVNHRIKMESNASNREDQQLKIAEQLAPKEIQLQEKDLEIKSRGQWFGFIIVILLIVTAVISIVLKAPWQIPVTCFGIIVAVAGVFVIGKYKNSKQDSESEPPQDTEDESD